MCQWANNADDTVPIEYYPVVDGQAGGLYANGVKLVLRNDGWLPLGSCPVRFEGDSGWVETGDSGKFGVSSQALLACGVSGELRDGRQRQVRRQLSGVAGMRCVRRTPRPAARFPRPRFPQLRQVAR